VLTDQPGGTQLSHEEFDSITGTDCAKSVIGAIVAHKKVAIVIRPFIQNLPAKKHHTYIEPMHARVCLCYFKVSMAEFNRMKDTTQEQDKKNGVCMCTSKLRFLF